jgi:ribonuclease P protein component
MVAVTTLKHRADFLRLRQGRKYTTSYFIMRTMASPGGSPDAARVGYTVTTKCGNAVRRNRIKRRLRAAVREVFPPLAKPGYDYVLIALAEAKPSLADAPFDDVRAALAKALTGVHR